MNLWRSIAIALGLFTFLPAAVLAQNAVQPSAQSTSQEELLKPQELDSLVAPIALYPDPLLSEVLMASTYPLEIVQAERWLSDNKDLKGDQLKTAVDQQPWDESVKSLIATPSVLSMLNEKLDWTQKLGDAVLAQQDDVMDAVQRLRIKAEGTQKLQSTKEQTVTRKQVQGKEVIAIEPTEPDTVYVPYYDPAVVYGDWPYPDYPPYYFPEPAYLGTGIIATGIAFGGAYALGRWASGGNYWGGGINWDRNNIISNRPIRGDNVGNNWQHRPEHRQGVKYNNASVQQRFGEGNRRTEGQRPQQRAGQGERAGQRTGQGQRAGQGERTGQGARTGQGGRAEQRTQGDRARAQQQQRGSAQQRGSNQQRSKSAQRPSASKGGTSASKRGTSASKGAKAAQRPAARSSQAARSGRSAAASRPAARPSAGRGGGGAMAAGRGGGGFRGGGGRGGGRRSDIALKHDIVLLGHLSNGLGFYRFSYNGSQRSYVGVLAQEVTTIVPEAVTKGPDGYLRVFYDKLGLKFQTYKNWRASGAKIPTAVAISH